MRFLLVAALIIGLSACAENKNAEARQSVIGSTQGCKIVSCGTLCAPIGQKIPSEMCGYDPKAKCYEQFGRCVRIQNGCDWQKNYDLTSCLNDPENYLARQLRPDRRDDLMFDPRNPWIKNR